MNRWLRTGLLLLIITSTCLSIPLLALASDGVSDEAPPRTVVVPSDAPIEVYPGAEWTWAESPEALGWSSEKLSEARAYADSIGTAAVMIVEDGIVIDAWGDLTRTYHCHSMRKSLLSALYGIYVGDGIIDITRTLEQLDIDEKTP